MKEIRKTVVVKVPVETHRLLKEKAKQLKTPIQTVVRLLVTTGLEQQETCDEQC